MITATDEQVAVIRRGWMGTAVAVHPEVNGLTTFVESSLLDLESRGELAENDLLAVVEAAAQMVLAAGNPDQARDTSRRMRRTVYEFLLALDASSATEAAVEEPGRRRSGGFGTPESQARSERAEQPAVDIPAPADEPAHPAGPEAVLASLPAPPDEPLARDELEPHSLLERGVSEAGGDAPDDADGHGFDWAALAQGGAGIAALPDEAPATEPELPTRDEADDRAGSPPQDEEAEQLAAQVAPRAGFHLTDPVELLPEESAEPDSAPASVFAPLDVEDEPQRHAAEPAPAAVDIELGDFELMPLPEADTAPTAPAGVAVGDHLDGPGEAATFTALVTPPAPERPPASQAPAAWSAKVTEANRPTVTHHEPSLVPDVWADPEPAEPDDQAGASAADVAPAAPVWRVRKPELAGEGARHASSGDLPPDSWQPADHEEEVQPDLSAPRREIEELLRRKKYDQTGAVLQQLAQDNACRAVAELALDTGDRCRAMGKRMAATSCYLAASRADPVFEEPLARLADVCIDDRDVDLAVSYLERVARLSRARSDIKGALRMYRKIHAIAPHRHDILDVLMRAQSTGRLDP